MLINQQVSTHICLEDHRPGGWIPFLPECTVTVTVYRADVPDPGISLVRL